VLRQHRMDALAQNGLRGLEERRQPDRLFPTARAFDVLRFLVKSDSKTRHPTPGPGVCSIAHMFPPQHYHARARVANDRRAPRRTPPRVREPPRVALPGARVLDAKGG